MRSWEDKALTATYLILSLGSLAAAIAVLIRGDLSATGLDGIFLMLVCLLFAAVFGLIGARDVRLPILEKWRERKARSAVSSAGKAEATATRTEDAAPQQPAQPQSKTAR